MTVHRLGPGVGGHCIPIDPWFLVEDSDYGALVETARQVNESMTEYVIELLRAELGVLEEQTIGVLGISYRGDVSDTRESPGFRVVQRLRQTEGTEVLVNDPHVSEERFESVPLDELFDQVDGVIVTTDHDEYASYTPPQETSSEPVVLHDGSGEIVIDTKDVLTPEMWNDCGYRLIPL